MRLDLIAHALAGAAMGAAVAAGAAPLGWGLALLAALTAALVAGWAKEIVWDAALGRGQFDAADAWATTLGGPAGWAMTWAAVWAAERWIA